MLLSVVVPVRNEAENITPLVAEISAALTDVGQPYEIVYVNDGSTDSTAAELKAVKAKTPVLRVLSHAESQGQSRALITGIRAARGDYIVQLDGDGQNDPSAIPRLWARLQAELADNEKIVICGWRKNRKDPGWRQFTSQIAKWVRAILLGDRTPDTGCGLKMYSRAAFMTLPHFDHMHRFLPALFTRAGYTVISVEVNHRQREHGHSNYGTWDRLWAGIWDLMGVMWLQRRSRYPDIVDTEPAKKD